MKLKNPEKFVLISPVIHNFTQYNKTVPQLLNLNAPIIQKMLCTYYKIAVLTTFSKNDGRRKCVSHFIPHREFGFLNKFTNSQEKEL